MRRALSCLALLPLAACSGLAWNTEVAVTPASRTAMAETVIPGTTTERAHVTRWGYPTQKVREGAQTEYIYRDMRNLPGWYAPQFGDSHNYVIVTFQYGIATGVRTSDGIDCRATFPPRPPGTWVDNPSTVRLVGTCAPPLTAEEAARKGPIATAWEKLTTPPEEAGKARKGGGQGSGQAGTTPGVPEDSYDPAGKISAAAIAGATAEAPAPDPEPDASGEIVVPVIIDPAEEAAAATPCDDAVIGPAGACDPPG